MLQQSESDTKVLQGDTGIIFTTIRNSAAFFFNKYLVGPKAVISHKLNCLLYLQGSWDQRGSSRGSQAIQGFPPDSACQPRHEATRGTAGAPTQPLPATNTFGHHLWETFRVWEESRQSQPGSELSLPTPAPAPRRSWPHRRAGVSRRSRRSLRGLP